jgi:eukaryotic-like serine/threonine-protein kinase
MQRLVEGLRLGDRYVLQERIASGGMADVWRGLDDVLRRDVAVKVMRADPDNEEIFAERFRDEARHSAALLHPNITTVFDYGEDDHLTFLVMELVLGLPLSAIIREQGAMQPEAVRSILGQAALALGTAHDAGVVHRDIKPGNVMITEAGQVKVMDFGIARAVSDSSSTVAETTAIIGTAAYFSPEQAKGEPVDARADVYSTGVVLYELLAGRPPFRGESPVAVAYQHVSEAPLAPSEVNETVPRSLDTVALRALAKDPFQRYQDAAAFREALDATVDGKSPSKRAVGALTSELYGPNPRQAAETARSLRQLSTDTTMKRTQAGPPVAWIWAGVAILAVLLISVLFWVLQIRPGGDVPSIARIVPDVSGMTYERAATELGDDDLIAFRVDESNADVAAGNVIRTDPPAGASVSPQQEIRVYVSTGQETAAVPTLEGLSQEAATTALQQVGLALGSVTPRNDPGLAAGTVISADQTAGSDVPVGTAVNLVVATGRVVIVDVTGYTIDAATRELEGDQSQLIVVPQEDPSCTAADPPVVRTQSIPPGEAPVHSEVILSYCTGP